MARPKSVTIRLSPKQRDELKRLTGEDHSEVMFESVKTYSSGKIASKATLASKTAPRTGTPTHIARRPVMKAKSAPAKKISLAGKAAPAKKIQMSSKAAPAKKIQLSAKAAPAKKIQMSSKAAPAKKIQLGAKAAPAKKIQLSAKAAPRSISKR